MTTALNIADRLRNAATQVPRQRAVVYPAGRDQAGRVAYTQLTFAQLDHEVDCLARGMISAGVQPGHRIVLMVRPSLEFVAFTFAIFRTGAICTLIDPGMGRGSMFRCLDVVDPDGFAAIPQVHWGRRLMLGRFRNSRLNFVTGKSIFTGAVSYAQLIRRGRDCSQPLPTTHTTDPAAIIFTSGSTGVPKGVLYEHGMFDAQVDLIRDRYQITAGEVDLPGFPLFSLFNLAMQVTTVIPDMDPTRPANVNPVRILEAIEDQAVTQAYGSPSMWNRIGRHCEASHIPLKGLKRVLSAGAPVPNHVLKRMTALLAPDADVFTPYGATECLPVASVGGRQVLQEFAKLTATGKGTCVGTVFDGMEVRIIRAADDVIANIEQAHPLPTGEIGEIIVRGPVATREYFRNPAATAMAKISDGSAFWHRMGDVGYLDEQQRLWFCGRRAHIVHAAAGPMYSVCCEAIFNTHPEIYRCALVGVGERGQQQPVIVAEPEPGHFPKNNVARQELCRSLLQRGAENPLTSSIRTILLHRSLPVDTRHNVKINREQLAIWAATQLPETLPS